MAYWNSFKRYLRSIVQKIPLSFLREYRLDTGVILAWITLILSLGMSAGAWQITRNSTEQDLRQNFSFQVLQIENRIRARMRAYELVLYGGAGLFEASGAQVGRTSWKRYIESLKVDENYPGILGIGYSVRIPPEQLGAHTREVRSQGFPDYNVWPEGPRNEYTAIIYLEPFNFRNRRAFGYDMFQEPVRHAAMVHARDMGVTSVSGRVILVQETASDVQAGFLMYVPLYRNNMPTDTIAQRRNALLGYVYSPFRMKDLMTGILGENNPHFLLWIYDGTDTGADSLMYSSAAEGKNGSEVQGKTCCTTLHRIIINNRTWTLRIQATSEFRESMEQEKPVIVLVSGMAISVLLFLGVHTLATTRRRAMGIATEMTTALRESENRFRQLLQQASDAIYLHDEQGRILEVNQQACNDLQYSRDELLHMNVDQIDTMFDRKRLQDFYRDMPTGGAVTLEGIQKRKDGSLFPIEIRSGLIEIQGKRRILGLVRNVTERKEAERKLQSMNETLEAKVAEEVDKNRKKDLLLMQQSRLAAMGEMIGNIAHQWRQPLNALAILLYNLQDAYDYGELKPQEMNQTISEATELIQRMSSTIDDFRNFLKPSPPGSQFILQKSITETIRLVEPGMNNNGIQMAFHPGDREIPIHGVSTEFSQVLLNLLNNSRDAILEKSRGAEPERIALELSKENGWVKLTVTDTGGGIPAEVLSRIFEPYFTTRRSGTGIGLYMSRMILQRMGGRIEASNMEGGGACFTLLLPVPAEKSTDYLPSTSWSTT